MGSSNFNIAVGGGVPLENTEDNLYRPTQLLDGNDIATSDFGREAIAREERDIAVEDTGITNARIKEIKRVIKEKEDTAKRIKTVRTHVEFF